MQKKILLQLFIFLTIVLISIVFLKTYFFKKQIIFLDDSNSKNSNLPIDKTYDEVSSN